MDTVTTCIKKTRTVNAKPRTINKYGCFNIHVMTFEGYNKTHRISVSNLQGVLLILSPNGRIAHAMNNVRA